MRVMGHLLGWLKNIVIGSRHSSHASVVHNVYGNPLPNILHSTISHYRRTIIIGDVHGCLDELKELLIKSRYDSQTCDLIFVGDLVNKGPYSAEVVQFVRSLNAYCVRGNHDEAALKHALQSTNPSKDPLNEKYKYVHKLSTKDIEWLRELPYTISLPAHKAMVVHAGRIPNISLKDQSPWDYVNMRNLIQSPNSGNSYSSGKMYKASDRAKEGEAWAGVWNDDQCHIYFGHDAKRELQLYPHATGLDTGACYGKFLTAIILPSHEIVQVKSRQVYETTKS